MKYFFTFSFNETLSRIAFSKLVHNATARLRIHFTFYTETIRGVSEHE